MSKVDIRLCFIILLLMAISLLVISSMTMENERDQFFTSPVRSQLEWFLGGWAIFFFFSGLDYHKFASWSPFLYFISILLLMGLFLTEPVRNVHRWYRLPFFNFQPSEYAKLVVVMTLGWFLDKKRERIGDFITTWQIFLIAGIPFFLILKQPDLGTALVLFPITLVMCYFGEVSPRILKFSSFLALLCFTFVCLMFSGTLSHEKMKPFFSHFLKEYQYERLSPKTYHQEVSQNCIAAGGLFGSGWKKSEFSSHKWLPAAHTDSVFSAYAEEFGFVGSVVLLSLFYALIYFSFRVVVVAKDHFGRLLAAGLAVYLAMHIMVNIGMMCGFLPISGVPLVMITYGGSSVMTTMAALGILQSVYTRRFMF